jgi:trimeric autotransporter adhesin
MASTYINDLRLNEMATGDGSGTWGTTTNTNLELIAEAFSYGTEVITTNADTHTTTIADGATDPGRSLYLKYTGTLDSACTITIGPNTVSKVWIIENGTSGSQDIIISQGSGANITIPAGDTKVVYSDGAGAGAAFFDAFTNLNVSGITVDNGTIKLDGNYPVGTDNVALGNTALDSNSSGNYSTAVGSNALTASTASSNTGVGFAALEANTSGTQNTAIGMQALTDNTTANNNTAVGHRTLFVNTTGASNVAIGVEALAANTTAANNTAVGFQSLNANTEGYNNTAVGSGAMLNTTTGVNNTAVGSSALETNTTGYFNCAMGQGALGLNESGINNVAIGYQSLLDNTDSNNTAVGHLALTNNTSGADNTATGSQSLSINTTGGSNSAFGRYALLNNTTASNNTAVGRSSLQETTTGANNTGVGYQALYVNTEGANNVAVGIGALKDNTTGATNTALGSEALNNNTTASNNVAIGVDALYTNTTGAGNTAIGKSAGSAVTIGGENIFIGFDAGLTGSPGGNITSSNRYVLIGDENIAQAHIQVDWTVASDARDKTDFTALDLGLDFVKALAPVTYKWDKRSKYGDKTAKDYDLNAQTPDGTHKEDWLDIGFKAQEVEALEIAAGYTKDNNTNLVSSHTSDGKQMGLQYSKFVPILVKALQEADDKIDALTTRIEALEG